MKLTKKQLYIIGGVVLLIALGYLFFGRSKTATYTYFEVKRGDIVQEVSATGNVKPVQMVDLGFEITGKVSGINVDIGSKVSKGQVLVYLDNSQLSAQLAGVEASLKAEQATLAELQRGTRPEEIQVQEVKVANAAVALDDTKKTLVDALNDALTKTDDAVRNQIDQFISNPTTQNSDFTFAVTDTQIKNNVLWERYTLEAIMASWKNMVVNLNINSDLDSITAKTNTNLSSAKTFLDDVASIVNSLASTNSLTSATITTYKTSVNTARTNVNTAITNLSAAYEGYQAAKSDLSLQQNTLALKKAGTVPEQITAQEAVVEKARADVNNYKAQIARTILRSPIDGVVTRQDLKVGEIAMSNSTVVSVISSGDFQIEVDIPEADIAKVKVGDSANITLDAYGSGVVFTSHVTSIDPGETMVEGVATYKTTLQFDKKEDAVKSGMTANIDILTDKRTNVLFVPQRSIITQDNEKFVLIDAGGAKPEQKKIEIGLRGSDGNSEVVFGLVEGEKIIATPTLE